MSKLITQDLISGIDWFRNCPRSWKDQAYHDLKNKLGRVRGKMHPSAIKGIALENTLNNVVNTERYKEKDFIISDNFKLLVEKVIGYSQQKKTKSYMTIKGIEYCLYGKIDYFRSNHIIDLKSTGNYKGASKYLNTFQHKIYCYNEKIKDFTYLIAEFEREDSNIINKIYAVDYHVEDFETLRNEIEEKIKEIISFLEMDEELFNLYNDKYCMF